MSDNTNQSKMSWSLYVTIVSAVIMLIAIFQDSSGSAIQLDKGLTVQIFGVLAAVSFLWFLANLRAIKNQFVKFAEKKEWWFDAVLVYRRGHLEYMDAYGKVTKYSEELLLKRIRRGSLTEGYIRASGTIDPRIHTYNCYNSLNHSQNKVVYVFGRRDNKNERIINTRQLQYGIGLTFHNTFISERESFDFKFLYPTRYYDLKISFYKKNPPRNATIERGTTLKNGDIKYEELPLDPLENIKYNKVNLKVKLLKMKKGDHIRVSWNQKTDPKKNKQKKKES